MNTDPSPAPQPSAAPTPRTDAMIAKIRTNISLAGCIPKAFARELERELTAARAALEKIAALPTGQLAPADQCAAVVIAMDARDASPTSCAAELAELRFDKTSVVLVLPAKDDPFRRCECNVIDRGYADNILTVECPAATSECAELAELMECKADLDWLEKAKYLMPGTEGASFMCRAAIRAARKAT